MIIPQLIIGSILISITVVIHAVCLDFLIRWIEKSKNTARLILKTQWKMPLIVIAVLGVFLAHIIEIWVWAIFYLLINVPEITDFEEALYFSTSSFTTVGFGDLFLAKENWRLVSSFQAANGFILFGWSTAFIFEIIKKLYEDDSPDVT